MEGAPQKVLDLTYLIEASDGDADFISDIVGDYLREMQKHVADLKGSLEHKDHALLVRAAHTVKGASANVGAHRVRDVAAKLEMIAKKGVVDGSESMIDLIAQEIARVKDVVEREGIAELLRAS